ncbi:MAG: hypothetical protein IPG69_01770 [Flavobacteriales bacterium]|nr:hypothetical protein [Flavobacteriales bacterium]
MIRSNMTPVQVASAARKDVGQVLRHATEKHSDLERLCTKLGKDKQEVRSGCFTSQKGLQWVYVAAANQGRVRIYPLVWWATRKGTCAMQIDAEGPAAFFQEHVMHRYIKRYLRGGTLFNALREFHRYNYEKASQPCDYKGDRESYTAVIDDGYVAGEYLKDDAIVHYRTYYDMPMGERRFGYLRPSLDWRQLMATIDFERVARRDTPHFAWGRGYLMRAEMGMAA